MGHPFYVINRKLSMLSIYIGKRISPNEEGFLLNFFERLVNLKVM